MTILLIVMELGKFMLPPGDPRCILVAWFDAALARRSANEWTNLYHNYNRLPAPLPGLFRE
jgi:hypothetical protein